MKNRVLFCILMLLLLTVSCSKKTQGISNISGRITDAPGQLLKLQELGMQESKTIDSVILDSKGDFSFSIFSKPTGLYLLSLPHVQLLVVELNKGDSVKVNSSLKSFPFGASFSASDNSRDLLDFFNITNGNRKIYDSLESTLLTHQYDPDFALLSRKLDESLKPLWEKQRELEITYIDRHLSSLTALLILNQGLGSSPVLTFKDDSVYFLKLDSSLSRAFPGNMHAVFHHKRIIQEREMAAMKKNYR